MNWGGFGGRGEEGFNESIGNDGGGEGSHGNGLWKAKEGGEEEEDDEEGREGKGRRMGKRDMAAQGTFPLTTTLFRPLATHARDESEPIRFSSSPSPPPSSSSSIRLSSSFPPLSTLPMPLPPLPHPHRLGLPRFHSSTFGTFSPLHPSSSSSSHRVHRPIR